MKKLLPPTLAALAAAALFSIPHPALALSASSTTTYFTQATNMTAELIGFMGGPIVKIVALVILLSGVYLMSRGNELHEGIKGIGGIVLAIGILLAGLSFVQNAGAGSNGTSSTLGYLLSL